MLAAALPVRRLASALPVPLMAAVPVSTRFSTWLASVWVTERLHRVDLRRQRAGFGDHVGGVVHDIGVVAQPAGMVSAPAPPSSDVGGGVAGEAVGQGVAGAVDGGGAGEHQVFQFAPSVWVTDDCTVSISVARALASVTTSAALSTT